MEKGLELFEAEVGEDLAVPVEDRGAGLVGDSLHRGRSGVILGDVHLPIADAMFGQEGTGFGAPGATGFDVEDGKFGDGHALEDSSGWKGCGSAWASFHATFRDAGSPTGMHSALRTGGSWLIGIFFIFAGVFHFVRPAPYLAMIPPWLPHPGLLVAVSGLAEIAGGIGVFIGRFRRMAAWGLIALLLAVFPANLHVALHGWPGTDFPRWVLWVRLPFQVLFVWLVYTFCLATGTRRAGAQSPEVEWPDVK